MEEEGKGVGEYEDRGVGAGGRRMEKGNGEKDGRKGYKG